jgi:hypothetical protein
MTECTAAEMEEENRLRQREIQQKNEIVAQYNAQNPNGEKASYFEYLPYEYEERFEKTTYYKRITPNGRTLCKGKSPYKHQSSPYVFEVRPLDDGDIQGEGNQLIDIQKLYNRLRLLMDIGIRHGVKGVLLIPSTAVPDGFTSEEYVKRIRTMGEYVIYKVDTKSAHAYKPEMVSGAMPIVGMIQGLLQDLKQMMSDISGTSQAMLGREEDRTITASQYKMESNNSAVNAVDFFKSFDAFLHRRNLKVLKLLQQYYPDMRRIVVRGVTDTSIFNYQAEKMAHLDTDVMILSNANTELQKAQSEASLKEAVIGGILKSPLAKVWLKNSSEPWAKGILADLEQMEQAQQQAQ